MHAAPDPPMTGDDWRPMVALRHVRDGHPDHVDWLLARDGAGEQPLWSFRCPRVPDASLPGPMGLQGTADHRPRYLTYEGPISGDRGHVIRIARGRHRVHAASATATDARMAHLELAWDGASSGPYFVMIGTKSPDGPPAVPPPAAEHDGERVHWLIPAS